MLDVTRHALMITGFVFVMMLVIEYLNVLTSGAWRNRLARNQWGQYMLAAALGAVPGCLGAFAVVAMFSHRLLSLGAVVAAMIATSGDESFVMFAMIPGKALVVTAVLFAAGILFGALTDAAAGGHKLEESICCDDLTIHEEFGGSCLPRGMIIRQWRECSAARGVLAVALVGITAAIITGQIGPPEWNWMRVTLLVGAALALFIVSTVSDHFLDEHLWRHIARKHAPRIFLWSFGVLLAMYVLTDRLDIDIAAGGRGRWVVLPLAALLGLIPQSGPHLVFVTLYAKGAVPLGILLASSVVQDGHGMIPLLAHSRRAFFIIKGINLAAGMIVGAAALAAGF